MPLPKGSRLQADGLDGQLARSNAYSLDGVWMISAEEAFLRLREGNRRFASDEAGDGRRYLARVRETESTQQPIAVVLGCSDSRVPPEIIFGHGIGDLFVVRVAGNVPGTLAIGSVEFATEQLGTRLVVVLGHSGCGAVAATLASLRQPRGGGSPHLGAIIDSIRPAVEAALESGDTGDGEALLGRAVRANVRASVSALRRGSTVLEGLIEAEGLVVVGAEYSLESGVVEFFDDV